MTSSRLTSVLPAKALCVATICLYLGSLPTLGVGQDTSSEAEESVTQPQVSQKSEANLITQQVVRLGAFSCAARVEQVTSYLGFGPDTTITIRTPKNPANQKSLSIALNVPSIAEDAMAFADFYPLGTDCTATYHLVFTSEEPCETVAAQRFNEFGQPRKVGEKLLLLSSRSGMRVFLHDASGGCTITKTETLE